jgi:hypothetical protein
MRGIRIVRSGAVVLALFVFGLALAGESTPLKGWGSGAVVGINSQPTYLELTIAGTGQATQLGRFSRIEVIQIDAHSNITGTIEFTSASGEKIEVSVVGQFVTGTTAVGTYTVTGGTGRFSDATGSAEFVAVSLDGLNVQFRFDGLMSLK